MVMVDRSFNFLYRAELSENARIEPGPLGWHTSAPTTELQEVRQQVGPEILNPESLDKQKGDLYCIYTNKEGWTDNHQAKLLYYGNLNIVD